MLDVVIRCPKKPSLSSLRAWDLSSALTYIDGKTIFLARCIRNLSFLRSKLWNWGLSPVCAGFARTGAESAHRANFD
jgi:hypothetical protein